jgi:Putative prokaryotic signal transducing protein
MKEILRTTDVVLLSFVQHVLAEAGIRCAVFDDNMSIMEGSLGVLPRRLMVAAEDFTRARAALAQAGYPKA